MALSGSYDFTVNESEIIKEACELTGKIDIVEGVPPELYESVRRTLNLFLKSLQSKGLLLHTYKEASLFLALNSQSYLLGPTGSHATESFIETTLSADVIQGAVTLTLDSTTGMSNGDYIGIILDNGALHWTTITDTAGVTIASGLAGAATSGNRVYTYTTKIQRPLKITDVRIRQSSGAEIPLNPVSLEEYFRLPNKATTGLCNQFAFDPQLTDTRIYVWPVANDVTARVLFRYKKPLDDVEADEHNIAVPQDWFELITLGLAHKIAPKLRVSLEDQASLKARYEEALADIDDFEEASVFFGPDRR